MSVWKSVFMSGSSEQHLKWKGSGVCMEFLIVIGSKVLTFHFLSIVLSGVLRFVWPKLHLLMILGANAIAGFLFLQKLELTWSVVFLGINLLTALGGIGIASLLRKLIRDLHEEGGTGHTR